MEAVFIDRDGVVNELIYYEEHGIIDSPFVPDQFRLLPGAADAIRQLREAGYSVIMVSNQPGIANNHMSAESFDEIRKKMRSHLAAEGAFLDGEYYCLHHPEAKVEELRVNCECRKPKPGLLLQAADELNIDMVRSWIIGDGLTDIIAGKAAGCKSVLLANMKCELCQMMTRYNASPDSMALNLAQAARYIVEYGGYHANIH